MHPLATRVDQKDAGLFLLISAKAFVKGFWNQYKVRLRDWKSKVHLSVVDSIGGNLLVLSEHTVGISVSDLLYVEYMHILYSNEIIKRGF
ncbi:hypothetical protein L1987_73491 [Smallanthus sonchifolius]|uniref:Uncharacterized protein n=1 Tax=Smallanthus sonchifolius TaxID=185202 RepID=A0ACB9A1D2_9ASTR|nr:hypothetical protein L1987_73491 [Smallanthus sonchifolius]